MNSSSDIAMSLEIDYDPALLVDGKIPHSVWSNIDDETVMIGISVK